MANGKKKNNYIEHGGKKMIAMYVLVLLFFLKVSFMTTRIGVNGMAYFALAFAVFYMIYCVNGSFICENIRKMVIFQVNRRSVRNAIKLNRVILQFTWLITILLSGLIFIFSEKISEILFGTPLVSLSIRLFALALLFLVPQQCMKGYLEGISSQIPGIVSMFILMVIDLVTTILIQKSCMDLGRKVADVMRNEQYYYAYAAIGGIIGLCVGSFFSLLFLLLITGLLKQMQRERMRNDESKSKLSTGDILHNYIRNGLQEGVSNLFCPFMLLFYFVLYMHHTPDGIEATGMVFVSLLTALPVLLNSIFQGKFAFRQIHSLLRRSDASMARDKIAVHLKSYLYVTLMISVFLIFSARAFNVFFFDQTNEALIGVFKYTQLIVLLLSMALFLVSLLLAYTGQVVIHLLYLLSIGSFFVFVRVFLNAGMSGTKLFHGAFALCQFLLILLGGFLLLKKSRFKNDLLRVFVLPLIAAIGLLLVCLLVDRVLFESVGAPGCLIIAAIVGYLSYQLIIIMSRTFDRHEWADLPFAGIAISIAKKLHMY